MPCNNGREGAEESVQCAETIFKMSSRFTNLKFPWMSQRVAAWLWKERPNQPATNISATKTQSKIIQQTNCQNLQTKKNNKDIRHIYIIYIHKYYYRFRGLLSFYVSSTVWVNIHRYNMSNVVKCDRILWCKIYFRFFINNFLYKISIR